MSGEITHAEQMALAGIANAIGEAVELGIFPAEAVRFQEPSALGTSWLTIMLPKDCAERAINLIRLRLRGL